MPRVTAHASPTLPELTYLPTGSGGGIRIIQRIGIEYLSLGTLLLNDDDGAITRAIITANHYQPKSINHEILSKWCQGQGRQPVTWTTLIEVLYEIELSELAQDIRSVMSK